MRALGVVVLGLALACGRRETPLPVPPVLASAPVVLDAEVPEASPPEVAQSWAEAISLERWDDAAKALDALGEADKARPEVRYARARVALERGDAASALPLLDRLETDLPLLADDIARHRAEAKLKVGPFAEAGEYFAGRQGAAQQLRAAEAFEKAKLPAKARAACDRVIGADKKSRAQEAEARALRVRLAEKPGDAELADARWLAVRAADLPEGATGLGALARYDASHPLTGPEMMARARVLGDAGKIDDALRAVDEAGAAPGPRVSVEERIRLRGMTLYRARGRYLEAAKALRECAALGAPDAAECAFHAARALSRADRDDEAMVAYADVSARYARSSWGDEATYFVPYLHALHGEWREAARGFDEYVRRYPTGAEKADAARGRAIAHLMSHDLKTARELFEKLADEGGDPVEAARMLNMAALAALRDGDKTHAVARWTEVARGRPLSWPALVARARLLAAGVAAPPAIDPPESGAEPPALSLALPAPADMLHRIGLDADAESALRDREAAVLAGAGARSTEALCGAYGELGRARRRYQVAQQVPWSVLATAPGARTRWAWDCAYPRPYESFVSDVEAALKLPRGLVYAVMRQESGFDPDALSPARAVGLMQLLPETAKEITAARTPGCGGDDARLTSPPSSIALGACYLRQLLDRFRGDVALAVAAYNAGPDAIERWAKRAPGMDLDVFVEHIPFAETRTYVARVMGNLARYAYAKDSDAGIPTVSLDLPAN
jgi:peptidoglycan lytic transglycosylase